MSNSVVVEPPSNARFMTWKVEVDLHVNDGEENYGPTDVSMEYDVLIYWNMGSQPSST